ncbi:nuclear transport factor 2 family protein [Ensifer aridi]|uniref:nuclear transport factor 2 family protein n=1 Tax=Ensifer aridi TaxID=1708715 RepID=UPI0009BFAEAD|nr:nuclear transport factor 2 family protein [Ensifer aridi]
MEDRKEFFFVNRSFPAALAIAAGILLAPCQSAFAAECTKKQSEPAMDAAIETQWGGVTVPSDDRQKIDDLFSRYAWALDQRDPDRFAALFTVTGSYEVCTGEGNIRIYVAASNEEIKMKIKQEFDQTEDVFQSRHVLANTLLRALDKSQAFLESKTTMMVTVQRSDGDRVLPEPDYTADVRGTLERDGSGIWRFAKLTVYADTPEFEPMGR